MQYVVGVDGGGTKTDIVLCSENGTCCDRIIVGGSNHQIHGLIEVGEVLVESINALLKRNLVGKQNVSSVFLGLSGADLPEDIFALERVLSPLGREVKCKVINDVWLPLAAMVPSGAGAVSICGTGHNTAVRKAEGDQIQISAFDFALGNWGGGKMLTEQAMHAAIRAMEHTGPKTMLTERLPEVYGKQNIKELHRHLYLTKKIGLYNSNVPQIITALALEGDDICIGMLSKSGRIQAEMTAGLIKYAGLQNSDIPIVLSGSLYLRDESGCLVDAYREEMACQCPNAKIALLHSPSVLGAALLALKDAGYLTETSKNILINDILGKCGDIAP